MYECGPNDRQELENIQNLILERIRYLREKEADLTTDGDGTQTISTGTAIGSAMEISASSATSTGNTTISMTYIDADVEAAGLDETDLTMSHYENGEWVEETNCTVDTANNTVTCTVDSID